MVLVPSSQGASLKPDESEGCSPVSGGRTIRLRSSWPSDDAPTPLRSSVDTGAEDRGGVSAEFAAVAPKFRTFPSKSQLGIAPDSSFQPQGCRVGTQVSPKMDTYPKGLVDTQHPVVLDDHPVVSAQSKLRTCEDAGP